jgi:hypothetical protein
MVVQKVVTCWHLTIEEKQDLAVDHVKSPLPNHASNIPLISFDSICFIRDCKPPMSVCHQCV